MAEILSKVIISVKKEDRLYSFELPNGSNLGEIYDVLHEMRSLIIGKIKEVENLDSQKAGS